MLLLDTGISDQSMMAENILALVGCFVRFFIYKKHIKLLSLTNLDVKRRFCIMAAAMDVKELVQSIICTAKPSRWVLDFRLHFIMAFIYIENEKIKSTAVQ